MFDLEIEPMNACFPNNSFPVGAINEFISPGIEDTTPTSDFVTGLLSSLLRSKQGTAMWISAARTLFPSANGHYTGAVHFSRFNERKGGSLGRR